MKMFDFTEVIFFPFQGPSHETAAEVLRGWLPLVAIIMVALFYHIGLGPIPWSFAGKTNGTLCLDITQPFIYMIHAL